MQVMPRDGIDTPCFYDRPTMKELEDPKFNVDYGSYLLADLLSKKQGKLREALFSYGPIDVGYEYADTVISYIETVKS
jgi:hypothetical protein